MKKSGSLSIKFLGSNRGAALVFVMLIMVVLSILGLAILSVTTSNYKASAENRKYESAYYIAEAGINIKSADINTLVTTAGPLSSTAVDFFSALETGIVTTSVLNDFQTNFGSQPSATVTVSHVETISDNVRKYLISSTGDIGNKSRMAEAQILVEWIPSNPGIESEFVYSGSFEFDGGSVSGRGATVNVRGNLNYDDINGGAIVDVSNIYVNGDANLAKGGATIGSATAPGKIYINGNLILEGGVKLYGDVYVAGNLITDGSGTIHGKVYVQGNGSLTNGVFYDDIYIAGNTYIKDFTSNSKVFVGGDLSFGWTPNGNFTVDYVGKLTSPKSYDTGILSRCKKVTSIPGIPTFIIPTYTLTLKQNLWYTANGYTIGGKVNQSQIPANLKILVDSYTSKGWQSSVSGIVTIISKGDITIEGKAVMTGILIAPYGKVTFDQGGSTFTGVVISKDGFYYIGGGSTLVSSKLSDYYSTAEMPILATNTSSGGGSLGVTRVTLYPVREK